MDFKAITMEIKDYIAVITLNRPPANSINMEMRNDLDKAIDHCKDSSDVRVIIITGAGDKGFSAGMDVTDTANMLKGASAIDLYKKIDRFSKPVIAALNGYALGGGCELAMACHFRFMQDAPKAVIGCPELNLGITPGWGGIQRMPRIIGRQKALELILLSKRLSPAEALEVGLVDKVFPDGKLMEGTMEFAAQLAKKAPLSVNAVLEGMSAGLEKGLDVGTEVDGKWSLRLHGTEDQKEGFAAFAERREPVFKGK